MPAKSSSSIAAHLAERLHASRRCCRKEFKRCQKKVTKKAVHKLRVELRRLTALLEVVMPFGCADEAEKILHTLKKRLKDSSALRDIHVQLELLESMWSSFPETACLKKLLERRCEKLTNKFERRISGTKFNRVNDRLKKIEMKLKAAAKKPTGNSSTSALSIAKAAFSEVERQHQQVRAEDAPSIHRLRIAFKRFRYICELLQPFLPAINKIQVNRMKRYQTRAGDVQDAEVLLVCMAQAVKHRKLSPANVRNFRSELIAQKRKVTERFMRRIDDVFQFRRLLESVVGSPEERKRT